LRVSPGLTVFQAGHFRLALEFRDSSICATYSCLLRLPNHHARVRW
jgi:hypothetical protein